MTMEKFYVKLEKISSNSKTKVTPYKEVSNSFWNSSFNPTFGNEIVTKPLSECKFE